jgi:hypothetical protein
VIGKYEELKEFTEKQFKRLTGVQRKTFEKMVAILLEAQEKRYRKAGRKGNLSIEGKLLMALEDSKFSIFSASPRLSLCVYH